jgi:pimeloyl-ACP methyl ester carboxylesterase
MKRISQITALLPLRGPRLSRRAVAGMLGAGVLGLIGVRAEEAPAANSQQPVITYGTVKLNGVDISYRETGPKEAPVLLLLHGFPSSSRMYQPLFESRLSAKYHLIAPDYPGFGHSAWPSPKEFSYTFDHLAQVVQTFTEELHLSTYTLFLQDYGGPVGLRLALAHPERVAGIIIQNAVSHEEGLSPLWETRRAYWADRNGHEEALQANFLSLAATRQRHVGNSPHPERINPDTWVDEFRFLSQPGQAAIQSDLFFDYRTNLLAYPKWQQWLRERQPPLLVLWGRYDPSFTVAGAEAYRKDVPSAEVHLLEAGHFALDEQAEEIIALTEHFLDQQARASRGVK